LEANPKPSHKKAITWMEMTANGKEMITASAGEYTFRIFRDLHTDYLCRWDNQSVEQGAT
jgi:hypothetical protein